ncbi:RNA polymerase sigma-70 factor [Bacteroides sp. UBA939]|uniref:RNA polymerase sigma-70 factor n=1 Tax=Bacteroides sp. UBA939 TaxID=1946092 RepID=UPI0025BBEA8E|nr:RNA polymerase sigma-70 factor [Bacteroides sp. UBA939]
MATTDDILLLKLVKEGDEHAFKHLFNTYFTPLCRYINIYLDNFAETEELALDIFTYLWENKNQIEIKLSFKAYLFQSARNRCLNVLRDRKYTTTLDESLIETLQDKDYSALEMEELNRLIEEAVYTLPEKCREVFLKSRHDLMSNQEIANNMHISIKTVEAQITKALKRIKDFLGEGYSYLF